METEGYILKAFITNLNQYNEGNLEGEWVGFPTTYEHLKPIMDKEGISSSNVAFVTDYNTKIIGLPKAIGEFVNLNELNYLARELYILDKEELACYENALACRNYDNIKDLINLTYNLDNYDYHPEITNEEELGRYCIEECNEMEVPENILPYFDFEAYGRDANINRNGMFTENGYIVNLNGNFTEYYDGTKEDIPSEYCVTSKPQTEEPNKSMEKASENINRNRALSGISR